MSGPDHMPPTTDLPAKFREGDEKNNGDVAAVDWWAAFRDERLDRLVETGFERINAACADVMVAASGGLPRLSGQISISWLLRDAQTVQALRARVKTTRETLALSIGSYKDGQSSLLDVLDAPRSVATSQASLAQAAQQMAKDYVALNLAIGSGYTSMEPRSGQLLMNTEPLAVAAVDKRRIISDNPPFGRVS